MEKNLILWVVIALVLMSVFNNFGPRRAADENVDYSRFISDVKVGKVQKVVIEGRNISGILQTGERFKTYTPETDNRALIGDLLEHGVNALLADRDDTDELGRYLARACSEESMVATMRINQKERSGLLWNWQERMAVEIKELQNLIVTRPE